MSSREWAGAATIPVLIDTRNPGSTVNYPEQYIHWGYDDNNLYVAMRCNFPPGLSLLKGPKRESLEDRDIEVWPFESIEIWLTPDNGKNIYRFGGAVGGGYTESLNNDNSWSCPWTYRSSLGMTIKSTYYWDVEISIPLSSLGIIKADGASFKMNVGRTWRCFDRLGITSWTGSGAYGNPEGFGAVKLSPDMIGYDIRKESIPSPGVICYKYKYLNDTDKPFRGTLRGKLVDKNRKFIKMGRSLGFTLEPHKTYKMTIEVNTNQPGVSAIQYELLSSAQVVTKFVLPVKTDNRLFQLHRLFLRNKIVVVPAYGLIRAAIAKGDNAKAKLVVLDPNKNVIARQYITSGKEIWIDLPKDEPWGWYSARLFVRDERGHIIEQTTNKFFRPKTPDWLTARDDSMDRVLPPFTAIKTIAEKQNISISPWGRTYNYNKRSMPCSIRIGSIKNILAAPIEVVVDGKTVGCGKLKLRKVSDVRDELTFVAKNPKFTVQNDFWLEYDGLIYNTLKFTAKSNIKTIALRIPIESQHAQYAHITESGFGAGGGYTREVNTSFNIRFWPIIWLGDFERGLCWFAEGQNDLKIKSRKPIFVNKNKKATVLKVILAENIKAGQNVELKFGMIATPVKPLHPRYPLNIFGGYGLQKVFNQPPKQTVYAMVYWGEEQGFWDFKLFNKATNKWYDSGKDLARINKEEYPSIVVPYMTPYSMVSETPEANYYVDEWKRVPSNIGYGKRSLPGGKSKLYVSYCMSPQSISYNRFYAHKVAEMIKRMNLRGLYFDYGVAYRDSNKYHGANGDLPILGLRDFYRRIVNEFIKAGINDYVICVHNSMSMQIPSLTYVTHFFNGEQHRLLSSGTLRNGKDYLDTLPLYYFGIEQSSLPWGITANMLPELPGSEYWLKEMGVKNETVTEYLWDCSSSIDMPCLLHNSLPSPGRQSAYYYKKIYNALADFDVPSAVFHPYWRNKDLISVDNDNIKVSFYTRPEAPRALLVVGNLSKKPQTVTIGLDFRKLYDWSKADAGNRRVKKKSEILYADERMGARDAKILKLGPNDIKVWVKGHSMALIEVDGHQRL